MQIFRRYQSTLKPVNRDVIFRREELILNPGELKGYRKKSFVGQIEFGVKMELEVRGIVIKTRFVNESDCQNMAAQWKRIYPRSNVYMIMPSKMNFQSLMAPRFEPDTG